MSATAASARSVRAWRRCARRPQRARAIARSLRDRGRRYRACAGAPNRDSHANSWMRLHLLDWWTSISGLIRRRSPALEPAFAFAVAPELDPARPIRVRAAVRMRPPSLCAVDDLLASFVGDPHHERPAPVPL